MKRIFVAIVAIALLALTITSPARAQLPGTAMRAYIPFDFIVRGKTLPAGNYEVRRITESPEGLIIRNIDNKHDHTVFETEPVQQNKLARHDELVFDRYGDSYYFLSEVLSGGTETGRRLAPTREEKQLRRESEVASNNAHAETVNIALY